MSLLDTAQIPGYAEAVAREQALRDLAFDGQRIPLCGRLVNQFTLRHLMRLGGCDNAFVAGGPAERTDVAMFLWFVSAEYSLDPAARESFYRATVDVPFESGGRAINQYLNDAFWDCDGTGMQGERSYYSTAAGLICTLAREFGWDDEAILDKPIARLFQYRRIIAARSGIPLINRTDGMIGKWLAARNSGN